MAVGDGSPTSGGAGDVISTEDTWTDTSSGVSGQKLGRSKIVKGTGGIASVGSFDQGDIGFANELDVRDSRLVRTVERWGLRTVQATIDTIGQLKSYVVTMTRQARSVGVYGVTASLASVQILARANGRLGAQVANDSTSVGTLYLKFGESPASAAQGNYTVALPPGAYYELPVNKTEQPIQGLWSAAGGFANVTEDY